MTLPSSITGAIGAAAGHVAANSSNNGTSSMTTTESIVVAIVGLLSLWFIHRMFRKLIRDILGR